MALDPRIHAFRPDLADASLRTVVTAKTYVEPFIRQCLSGVLPMLVEPHSGARLASEVKYGEFLDVFEMREDGFIWVQNRLDHYMGYIPSDAILGQSIAMMSNRISALKTFIYPDPDFKTPPLDKLTLGSFISIIGEKNGFLELTSGGYVFAKHVMATEFAETSDYVFTAGRLLHTPYLWGGRTPNGLDCSGLVQLALEMAGTDAPRDTDLQSEAFGEPLNSHWRDKSWHRGDIVFMRQTQGRIDHVGIMTGVDHIIHASQHTMDVTVEPLADLVSRGYEIVSAAHASTFRH